MKVNKKRYNGCNEHAQAILHLIGQSQYVFNEAVSCKQVAEWMQVSKVTAKKHLDKLVSEGLLHTYHEKYKATKKQFWYLTSEASEKYGKGLLKSAYKMYAQRVMGIII